MSDPTREQPPVPDSPTVTARRSLLDRVSVVWLVPIGAMVIAFGVAWQTWTERGPVISILFTEASGVVAGETELRYRDVKVGVVERVTFTKDLQTVEVEVRLEKEVAPFVDIDAVFWVVRPQVSAQGISGLSTLLGGVYVQGSWDSNAAGLETIHLGLDNAPLAEPNERGKRIVLRSRTGLGMTDGMPILYHGIEVGRVGAPQIAADGISVLAPAFITAPHDLLLTDRSRFWDTSGISFTLGAGGARVDVASLTTLLRGGVSFDTIIDGGDFPTPGTEFALYETREEAEASLFRRTTGRVIRVAVLFEDNLPGLKVGAPVSLGGLEVGQVSHLTGVVDRAQYGDDLVRVLATLTLEFDELAMSADMVSDEDVYDFLALQVEAGLRARLTNASLLTGGLKVDLVVLDDPRPATLDRSDQRVPRLPSVSADVADVGATAEGLIARLNQLPVEELLASAIGFLDNASALVSGPDIQAVPGDMRALVGDIRGVVGNEAFQDLPVQITAVADEMRAVLSDLRTEEGVAKLVAAVEQAGAAAQAIGVAAEDLPALLAQIEEVAAKAAQLDLDTLVSETTAVVAEARTLIGGDAAQALPDRLTQALDSLGTAADEAAGLLTDLTEAEAAARLTAAIETAATAAQSIGTAAEGLPDLLAEIQAVAEKANALPLADLIAQATEVTASAQTILGADAAQTLPEDLRAALEAVGGAAASAETLLGDLTEAEAAARLTAAIETAATAAQSIGTAAEGLPDLLAEIQAVAEKANALALGDLVAQATEVATSAQTILGAEAARALPESLRRALQDVSSAAATANTVLGDLDANDVAQRLSAALGAASTAAQGITDATDGLPALIARVEAVAAKAEALALDALVAEARDLTTAAKDILASEPAQALPAQFTTALDAITDATTQAQSVLAALTETEAATRLSEALDAAAQAANGITTASQDVPALVRELQTLAETATGLPLDTLIGQASELATSAQVILSAEATVALPEDLRQALTAVSDAATSANALLNDLTEAEAAARLTAAIETAALAAEDIGRAAQGLPDLLAEITAVAQKANALPLEALIADADGVLASARSILAAEGAQALPDRLDTALVAVNEALAEASILFKDLNTLDSADKLVAAIEAAGVAAADVSLSFDEVPELVNEIQTVASRVNTLEIEDLLAEVTALVDSAEAVIGDEAAQALPESLNAALREITTVLEELRNGGTVENVNATLASARRAADSVATAADDLPGLVERTEAVLREAQASLASVGKNGELNREAQGALREITRAAEAIRSLARTIERKPNALLTGR